MVFSCFTVGVKRREDLKSVFGHGVTQMKWRLNSVEKLVGNWAWLDDKWFCVSNTWTFNLVPWTRLDDTDKSLQHRDI